MNLKKNFYELSRIFILVVFSISINQFYANQGLFPAESLSHYDISFRILKGDTPLVDYWAVSGIFIDYLQSLFLFFFGENFQTYVFHASLINGLLTLLIFFFFKNKIGSNLSFFYSLLSSILAYTTSGTLYIDIHASFLSLFSIIFFLFFYNYEKKLFLFISLLLLSFSILTKIVPAAYTSLIILFFIIIKIYTEKKIYLLKIFIFYSLIIFFFILLMFIFFNIPLYSFVEQYILFPLTIGKKRASIDILSINSLSVYKFVLIPIIFLMVIVIQKALKDLKKNYLSIINISILIFFSFFLYIHQVLTKNQEFIYFLIPILFGLLSFEFKFNEKKKEKIKNFCLVFFCSLIVLKYYWRGIETRRFHELENINLKNYVSASLIDSRFKGLKWINFNFPDNPQIEIKMIKDIIFDLEKTNLNNSIVISNYNFFSVLLNKNLNSPNRWFFSDGNVYPLEENNKYFYNYKNFVQNLIIRKNIEKIYIVFDVSENEILRYVNKNCFLYSSKLKNIKVYTKIKNCNLEKN